MSATEATPASPDVEMTEAERLAITKRLSHAIVFHEQEFAEHAGPPLMSVAALATRRLPTGHLMAAVHVRAAVSALPVHRGCCDAGR